MSKNRQSASVWRRAGAVVALVCLASLAPVARADCNGLGAYFEVKIAGGEVLPAGTLNLYIVPDGGGTATLMGSFAGTNGEAADISGSVTLAGSSGTGTITLTGDINTTLTIAGKANAKSTKLKLQLQNELGKKLKGKGTPGPLGGAFVVAKLDGQIWNADANSISGDFLKTLRQFQLGSNRVDGQASSTVALGIGDTGLNFPMTYPLGAQNAQTGIGVYTTNDGYGLTLYTTDATHTGTMTICTLDAKKGTATGTFSFTAAPLAQAGYPVNVTEGTFRVRMNVGD